MQKCSRLQRDIFSTVWALDYSVSMSVIYPHNPSLLYLDVIEEGRLLMTVQGQEVYAPAYAMTE